MLALLFNNITLQIKSNLSNFCNIMVWIACKSPGQLKRHNRRTDACHVQKGRSGCFTLIPI